MHLPTNQRVHTNTLTPLNTTKLLWFSAGAWLLWCTLLLGVNTTCFVVVSVQRTPKEKHNQNMLAYHVTMQSQLYSHHRKWEH